MKTSMPVRARPILQPIDASPRTRFDQRQQGDAAAQHLKSFPAGVRTGNNLADILYQSAFQEVADKKDVVIGIREPNELGAQLLEEGYASKSFHIKAKSSVFGPTAGFVAAHPAFGKRGMAELKEQQESINAALKHGASKISLRLSDKRVEFLTNKELIRWEKDKKNEVSARYGEKIYRFKMERQKDGSDLPWAVFHESGSPTEALTNPPGLDGPKGPKKAAVTADYDLFALFPRPNRANNIRPLNPVARVVGRNKKCIQQRANEYLDAIRKTGRDSHPDLGNFYYYGETIKNALNASIKKHGYGGGLLVHHGDETSNPYSPGQDFPVRFIVPRKPAILVENDAQLLGAFRWFRHLGYSVEVNPAFSFPSWLHPA
jgi:insecticidal toxin complex protein TccC